MGRKIIIAMLIFIAVWGFFRWGQYLIPGPEPPHEKVVDASGVCIAVMEGTGLILVGRGFGDIHFVRLIGVDVPDTRPESYKVAEYIREMIEGKKIEVDIVKTERTEEGSITAWGWVYVNSTNVNQRLMDMGYVDRLPDPF